MKAVILAGGLGTRLSEETHLRPKPMIEIGGRPIIWHIMKIYSSYGVKDFIICCGYKGYIIKEYFLNYYRHTSDLTIDVGSGSYEVHDRRSEPWRITLVDTGEHSQTGGRLLSVKKYLENDETFYFTYGDGVANVNLSDALSFHLKHGKEATMTVAFPPARFGAVELDSSTVSSFSEKPKGDGGYVNAGFFILNKSIFKRLSDSSTVWENDPLKSLAKEKQLMAYVHNDFWRPMDTLRDKTYLEELWDSGCAPWKVW